MFAKLLKYEWKATAPLLGALSLATLGAGLLAGLTLRLTNLETENEVAELVFSMATGFSILLLVLALVGFGLAATLLVLHRFYKNKFTDEGYLTFTLPVNSHQIFLSSLLNLLIWQVISIVVILLSLTLMVLSSGLLAEVSFDYGELQEVFGELSSTVFGESALGLSLLSGFTGWLFGNVLALTCIVLGSSWAKKHKLLLAFVLYYGITGIISVAGSILSSVVMFTAVESADFDSVMLITTGATAAIQLLLTVGCYFISTHMMSKELNLT